MQEKLLCALLHLAREDVMLALNLFSVCGIESNVWDHKI